MKKTLARFLTMALALAMIVCCFAGFAVSAAEADEEYNLFIAYGGDKAAESDWGWQYYGADAEGVTATNATIKVGETKTISLAFDSPAINSWFFAPCLITGGAASEITAIDFEISLKIDGKDVAIDMAADPDGKTWWTEDTGDFKGNCIRLAGGYNEWATKYIAEPAAFSTIEYTITLKSVDKSAPVAGGLTESTEEYDLFLAYGGDKAAENDWGWQYYGADAEGITATTAKVKSGDTATISLTFAEANVNSWFFAPCLIPGADAEQIAEIDFTVTCKIDGTEVPIDMAADAEGKTWWLEGTGDYANSIRLAGGYNEWGTKYIAEPAGFTTIEYTITFNSIKVGTPEAVTEMESTDTYDVFVAFGGDKAAENDWGWAYDNSAAVEGITAVTAQAKVGDTVTVSLTFASPVVNAWYFAPVLAGTGTAVGEKASVIDFDIVCKIDGVEVPIDFAADADGKTWWAEGTGTYTAADCIRLAGGYNEWATKYIAEPTGFTTIEYTITLKSVKLAVAQEPEVVEIPIDLNGTFNAYLMLQTPNWTFRDAHDSANGIGSEAWGQHITNNDTGTNYGVVTDAVIAGNGTYTVSITDFGTIFADDFAAASQDYFNIIAVSTDIPKSDKISITDVQLIVDGQVRHKYDTAYLNGDAKETIQILIQNIWNADVKEIGYYPAPSTSLEIQFTVSGFAYDKAAEEPEVTPTEPAATEPAATEPAPTTPVEEPKDNNTGLIVGIIAAVAVIAGGAFVVLKKKKA